MLLLLLSYLLLAPALFPAPQSNLPACCRRDGKHKCAKSQQSNPANGPQLTQTACPLFPQGATAAPTVNPAALPPPVAQTISLRSFSSLAAPGLANPFSTPHLHQPPRGPPSLLR